MYDATALHYATLYQDINIYNSDDVLMTALEGRATGEAIIVSSRQNYHVQNMLAQTRVQGFPEFSDLSSIEDQLDYLTERMFSVEFTPLELEQVSPIPGDRIHVKSVSDLLNHGAEINAKDRSGRTPLMIASALGYTDLASFLIDRGADVGAIDNMQMSVLHEAVNSDCESMMRLLLGCYRNEGRSDEFVTIRDVKRGETALHVAVRKDCSSIFDLLLKHGADINVVDSTGCAPLHTAVQHLHLNTAERLISAGANLNRPNNAGNTPLHCAIRPDDDDVNLTIVRMLLDHGADVRSQNFVGRSPLHHAIWYGFEDIVELLLDAGADANATDDYGNTPFHMIDQMRVTMAGILQDRGADVNFQNVRGLTPLHLACLTRKRRVIDHLVKMGANCNVRDAFGATPLHYAICRQERFVASSVNSYDPMINLLLDNDADCNIRTRVGGRTALHLACMNTDVSSNIINVLINSTRGSWYDNMGNSYLHYLAEYRSIRNLSDTPASLSLCRRKNRCGQTPLHIHANVGYRSWARKLPPEHLQQDKDGLGRTFMHSYFSYGYLNEDLDQIFKNLPREKDVFGRNCLHYVCLSNRPMFASWMEATDLINVRDTFGRTPLFYAALYQRLDFIEQLVSAGADANIADDDGVLPIDISLAIFAPESLAGSRVAVKQHIEQHVPEWATESSPTNCDNFVDDQMYEEWLALQRGRSDDPYKSRLKTEVEIFVIKLMAKVAELDPIFRSEPTLVGSAREGTRAKQHDEFDFMIVLNKFQALEDVDAIHERFPGYVRFQVGINSEEFLELCDEDNIVQPLFVKDRLYSLLIEACSCPDVWEGGTFEYLRTRIESNVYSPAVTMKSTLNRLLGEDKLYFYCGREISIDFVPAIPTRLKLSPDTPFSRYVAENLPKTDSRAFAVMKPHKYTIGNEANGFCPSNFIILEAEIVRRAPASVRAAYLMLKHLLFCKSAVPVDTNKYALKQCFLHCIVTHEFDSSQCEDVTAESLIRCVRVIMRRLWQCTLEDAVNSVYGSGHLLPFWEFEPFAGFLKVYFDSCGIVYTSDVCDQKDDDISYLMTNVPSDMQRTSARLQSEKVKSVIDKFRASYSRIQHLCSVLRLLPEPASDSQNSTWTRLEQQAVERTSQAESRLMRYVMKFDDSTNEFYVNEINRALLTPSPYYIGVSKSYSQFISIEPEEAVMTFKRIYRFK